MSGYKCTDHEGNTFPSIKKMCDHWNVHPTTFRQRHRELGWNMERSLTTKIITDYETIDSKNNEESHIQKVYDFIKDDLIFNNRPIELNDIPRKMKIDLVFELLQNLLR